jgi:hypothetical protein
MATLTGKTVVLTGKLETTTTRDEADADWEAQFKKALSERDKNLTGPTDNAVKTAFQDLAYLLWLQLRLGQKITPHELSLIGYSDHCHDQALASNPSTPVSLLEALAKDEDSSVRWSVAENPSTPLPLKISLLEALAKDKNEDVRRSVAENPSTPASVLEALALEPDITENSHRKNVESALGKASTILELRTKLIKKVCAGLKPSYARTSVLTLPDCPASALKKCGKSELWLERCAVSQNIATPQKLAGELKKDKHPAVSAAAKWRLSQSVS